MYRILAFSVVGLASLCLLPTVRGDEPAKAEPVLLTVLVQPNAQLEIEGQKTKKTGDVRTFISPPLTVGKKYKYSLKAMWTDSTGQQRIVTTEVRVTAGKAIQVDLRKAKVAIKETEATNEDRKPDVIYVPTPQEVVEKMLELAKIKKGDIVYDLGCGDGRIVVTAAKKYGVKAWGYDIDPERIKESNDNVKKGKVEDLVTIVKKDIFTLDLSKANVITLYLLPELNVKLIPQLEKLKDGSRIVSHDFDMEGVKPDLKIQITPKGESEREHTIYLWTTPLKKEKKE